MSTSREPERRGGPSLGPGRPAIRRRRVANGPDRDALARNVGVLSGTAAFATTWLLAWSPVLPLLLVRRGATPVSVAATFAAVNLGTALAQYFGGRLADRYGARLVIGWTGVALGTTWLAMAASALYWPALAAFYVLGNTLFGLQSTAFITIVSDSVPPAARMRAFSHYQFWSAAALVAGPLAGGLWLLHLPPASYLGATGLAYLLVGLARLALLHEPHQGLAAPRSPVTAGGLVQAAAGGRDRRQLLLLSVGVTLAFALTVQGPFMPVMVHSLDRLPMHVVEILFGIGPFGAMAASALAPRLGTSRLALGLGLTLQALAVGLMTLPLPPEVLVLAFVVAFAGFQLASIAFAAQRIELVGQASVGEVLGATSALAGIAAALGLLVAGVAGDRLALALGAVVALVTAGWHVAAGPRHGRAVPAGAQADAR